MTSFSKVMSFFVIGTTFMRLLLCTCHAFLRVNMVFAGLVESDLTETFLLASAIWLLFLLIDGASRLGPVGPRCSPELSLFYRKLFKKVPPFVAFDGFLLRFLADVSSCKFLSLLKILCLVGSSHSILSYVAF